VELETLLAVGQAVAVVILVMVVPVRDQLAGLVEPLMGQQAATEAALAIMETLPAVAVEPTLEVQMVPMGRQP
jgi:hypothetical protein